MFMATFPDNNVYLGLGGNYMGVFRYLSDSGALDSSPWENEFADTPSSGSSWISVKSIIKTTNAKVYAVAMAWPDYILMQYYPTLSTTSTSIQKVSVIQNVLSYILVAGLDSSDKNKLVMYDTSADTEEDLLPNHDIEVYNINFVAAENKVMFDGLNFANNKVVLGDINLVTKAVNLVELGTGEGAKLLDFKTFF
jgi:hypothetical protein